MVQRERHMAFSSGQAISTNFRDSPAVCAKGFTFCNPYRPIVVLGMLFDAFISHSVFFYALLGAIYFYLAVGF